MLSVIRKSAASAHRGGLPVATAWRHPLLTISVCLYEHVFSFLDYIVSHSCRLSMSSNGHDVPASNEGSSLIPPRTDSSMLSKELSPRYETEDEIIKEMEELIMTRSDSALVKDVTIDWVRNLDFCGNYHEYTSTRAMGCFSVCCFLLLRERWWDEIFEHSGLPHFLILQISYGRIGCLKNSSSRRHPHLQL